MAWRALLCSAALWATGAAAWAQEAPAAPPSAPAGEPLGAPQVRAALFGFELSGEVVGTGEPWSECIDPRGRTLWRFGDFRADGRLEVRPDGQACFRYSYTEFRREACWAMRAEHGRLRFDLVNGVSLPLVIIARRPVLACGGDAPIA
jgi:hypothetical protein